MWRAIALKFHLILLRVYTRKRSSRVVSIRRRCGSGSGGVAGIYGVGIGLSGLIEGDGEAEAEDSEVGGGPLWRVNSGRGTTRHKRSRRPHSGQGLYRLRMTGVMVLPT
jgi:hypothetical protein